MTDYKPLLDSIAAKIYAARAEMDSTYVNGVSPKDKAKFSIKLHDKLTTLKSQLDSVPVDFPGRSKVVDELLIAAKRLVGEGFGILIDEPAMSLEERVERIENHLGLGQ